MKKSLIALAVLAAAAGTASAQSSVTLFGIVDATLTRGTGSVSNKNQLSHSGYNTSRIGFRGTEDLGGGMSASFWLEAGVATDDGEGTATNANNQNVGAFSATTGANAPVRAGTQGLVFNRRSTVSLAGSWGELRLGRDYSAQFWNLTYYDPFGTNGVGTNQVYNQINSFTGVTVTRVSNAIAYFLPANMGGFSGELQYYLGENNTGTPQDKDGNGYGLRVAYANGPLSVGAALSRTKYFAGDVQQNNIGGSWDFGAAKLMALYGSDKNDALVTNKGKGYLIGGLIPVGAGEFRLSYSRYRLTGGGAAEPTAKKYAVGYDYNLSKRTNLYATYAHVSNSGGASVALSGAVTGPNSSSNGYDFGIRHSF